MLDSDVTVVKIGGNVIDNEAARSGFISAFAQLPGKRILVHGGGVLATKLADSMGVESKLVDGRRITSADMLQIATMVYGGQVNKQLVSALQVAGCNALGLTGADGNLLRAVKRQHPEIDFGYVGDVTTKDVNVPLLVSLFTAGLTPVLAPLTHDGKGSMLNTNADTVASVVAQALFEAADTVRLVYCFDKPGVLADVNDAQSVVPAMSKTEFTAAVAAGTVAKGMIPKLHNGFAAARLGVVVHVADAAAVARLARGENVGGTRLTAS